MVKGLFDFLDVTNRITFPHELRCEVVAREGDVHLRVFGYLSDTTKPKTAPKERQNGRWWRLSQHMTDGEVAQTAFLACMAFMEHETREGFKVDGVSVFDPHYDLEALVALRKSPGGGLKERETPTPLCASCGHPKDNHHYRHPFVASQLHGS